MKVGRTIGGLMLGIVVFLIMAAGAFGQQPAPSPPETKQKVRQLDLSRKPWSGDFDAMLERRVIRMVVPYSRSLYFNDRGQERGISAETIRDFERWINRKYAKKLGKRPLTVYVIPTTRDKMLPEVVQGLADAAVGNLTVTDERLKSVDFASPDNQPGINEVVVTGPKVPTIATTNDLAGKTVHVRKSSSYFESLELINERFRKEGRQAVKLVPVPDALEDEDMMEMVNAGLLEAIVVDDWKARMWAPILPQIRVNGQARVREGGNIGWAIRKGSPQLQREILDFHQNYLKKQGVTAYRLKKYMLRIKQIKDPTGATEWKRFEEMLAIFKTYGEKYGFDPLMLAAQGFQESQLDQKRKSPRGAIGVMQIMPATGRELQVGNIRILEPNIHAGSKYMDQLMSRYLSDANFKGDNRTLFAFASYNCGPGNVARLRAEAARQGLDPDEWFNNVEIVTARKIGMETTTYVRNIYKYYAAYRLQLEVMDAGRKARQQVATGIGK